MAHKTGSSSTKNTRNSESKRLGIKKIGNEYVINGTILVRQRGSVFKPGRWVGCGKDYTLFALKAGIVVYNPRKFVSVEEVI